MRLERLLALNVPKLVCVLEDSSVRAECACVCSILEALSAEGYSVGILSVAANLGVNVILEVKEEEVVVGRMPVLAVKETLVKLAEAALAPCAVVVEGAVN